ncbi:MAG: hypothetical protein L7U72_12110 [Rubripirellula sp.]|nr:hypothetical protein [Rubripirellula sp.]
MLDRQDRSSIGFVSDRLARLDDNRVIMGRDLVRGIITSVLSRLFLRRLCESGIPCRTASGGVNRSDAGMKYRDKRRRYFFIDQQLIETSLDQ